MTWNNVKNSLPEIGEKVIVYDKFNDEIYIISRTNEKFWGYSNNLLPIRGKDSQITHWTYLSDKPKE